MGPAEWGKGGQMKGRSQSTRHPHPKSKREEPHDLECFPTLTFFLQVTLPCKYQRVYEVKFTQYVAHIL